MERRSPPEAFHASKPRPKTMAFTSSPLSGLQALHATASAHPSHSASSLSSSAALSQSGSAHPTGGRSPHAPSHTPHGHSRSLTGNPLSPAPSHASSLASSAFPSEPTFAVSAPRFKGEDAKYDHYITAINFFLLLEPMVIVRAGRVRCVSGEESIAVDRRSEGKRSAMRRRSV